MTRDSRQEQGSVLLELALCLSLLVILTFGVASLGLSIREYSSVLEVARLAARAGANEALGGTPQARATATAENEFAALALDRSGYDVLVTVLDLTVTDTTGAGVGAEFVPAVRVDIAPRADTTSPVTWLLRRARATATFIIS